MGTRNHFLEIFGVQSRCICLSLSFWGVFVITSEAGFVYATPDQEYILKAETFQEFYQTSDPQDWSNNSRVYWMDVLWFSNHLLCKDFDSSSNGNNHLYMVV